MTTRTAGIGAGWRWLMGAINLGSRNAGAIFGAAALMLVVGLVPSILQAIVGQTGSAGLAMLVLGVTVAFWLLVMLPLAAGFLRVIHAAESGQTARATAIFEVFGDRALVLRMAGLGLVLMLLVFIIGVVMSLAVGQEFVAQLAGWVQALEGIDQENPVLPPLPAGLGTFIALAVLFGIFFSGVYMLALGQAALGGRGVSAAAGDGFIGTFKNVLPLALLALTWLVLGFVLLLVLGLVAALVAVVASLVHPVLSVVLLLPLYLGLILLLYVVSFGVNYFMWRDVCGGQEAAPDPGSGSGSGHSVPL